MPFDINGQIRGETGMKEIVKELECKLKDVTIARNKCEERICQIEDQVRIMMSQKNGARIDGRRQANGLHDDPRVCIEEIDEKLVQLDKERIRLKKKMKRLNAIDMKSQINKYKN